MKIEYCNPQANQYIFLHDVKLATVPARTLAIRIPSIKPAVTIDNAAALLFGGAKSPTRGNISWGVTVEIATKKDIAENTVSDFVTQRPILFDVS